MIQDEILEQLDKVIEYYNDMQSDSPDNLSLPNFHNEMAVLIDLRNISIRVERVVKPTLAEIPQKWTWFDLKSWNYQIYDDLLETIENEAKTYPIGDMGAIALWKLKDKISKCSL